MPRLLLTAAAALMAAVPPALAETALPPAISVVGEASIQVPPDLATIDGGVSTDAKTAKEAAAANAEAMAKVIQALKASGIRDEDLQTSRLSLLPQYAAPSRPGPNSLTGYRASNRVTVRLTDVSKVASVIDILVGAGANEIGGINFSVAAPSKLLDQARDKAMADARRKAEIYARAAGVTLGAPLSIAEDTAQTPATYRRMATGLAAAAPVAVGEETLSVNVSVSWAIKQTQ
ncbi:SIMPL domain-containing protein [Rhodopseudomonas pseudopalustris]|uniref:SIMPL domain-containing protein n=1 Tax=Rhodopseudomonas pseudopalustris TaxID=1513892 RepID=UPI003F96C1D9